MSREVAILLTLLAYKAALLLIGVGSQRRTRDEADFYLGGRRLGPTVAALSASASSSSAWTLLGVSGAAWSWGLSALWIFPSCVGGFLVNWYLLAPALQRESHADGSLTVAEYLAGTTERPLRRTIRTVASLMILAAFAIYVAAQFQGAGKTFHDTFGLGLEESILVGAGVVIVYTMLGGFWAVSLSDSLQGITMAAAAVLIPGATLVAVGGFDGLAEGLRQVEVEGFLSPTRDLAGPAAFGFVMGLLGIGLGYPGQPHVVNRFMALRDRPESLRIGRRVAVLWSVVVFAGMLLVGLCGRILYPGLEDGEVVFIHAANEVFPPVVAGALLAAVLSAIMSTADSQLLVAASALTHDLGLGGTTSRSQLVRSRLVVLGLSVGATVAALLGSRAIFERVLFAWSALGNAFGPLLLVRTVRGPVKPGAALAAMLVGFSLSVSAYFHPSPAADVVERVVAFLLPLGIALAGSRRRTAEER